MKTTRFLPVALLIILSAVSTFAQTPSFSRFDIATGLPLTGGVVVGDLNGDGKPDIVVTTHSISVPFAVYLLLGNGDGTFSAPALIFSGCCSGIAAGDVNGDSKLDLLFTSFTDIAVLLGNGDGTFQSSKQSPAAATPRSPLVADFNHDGRLDIALVNQGGGISILLGNGDGTFGPVNNFPITGGSVPNALAAGDFNGDGILDLAATNPGPANALGTTVSVLLGNGDGTFGSPTDFTVETDPFPVVAADFNGDGKLDLAVANNQSASVVSVLLGQGDGTFLPKMDFPVGPFPVALASADFNGDGRLDLAVGGAPTALSILSGNGDDTFAAEQDFPAASSMESLAVGDFNLDSKPDVVLVYFAANSTLSVFLNTTVVDTVSPAITVSANPSVLWPPTGGTVPVVVSGAITDTGSGVDPNSVTFAVTDEYGLVQPSGAIALNADGSYMVQVLLTASRHGSDLDGRLYTVTIKAKDKAGNLGSAPTSVTVPHDRRH
jgi:hypothetical protein